MCVCVCVYVRGNVCMRIGAVCTCIKYVAVCIVHQAQFAIEQCPWFPHAPLIYRIYICLSLFVSVCACGCVAVCVRLWGWAFECGRYRPYSNWVICGALLNAFAIDHGYECVRVWVQPEMVSNAHTAIPLSNRTPSELTVCKLLNRKSSTRAEQLASWLSKGALTAIVLGPA